MGNDPESNAMVDELMSVTNNELIRSNQPTGTAMTIVVRSLVVFIWLFSIATFAADEGKIRSLPVAVTAAALDAETGDIAIASVTENQIWVLPSGWFNDPNVQPMGPLAGTTQPISLLYKQYDGRSHLVVACFDSQGIVVFDGATREITASFPEDSSSPKVLVSASEDSHDPWIYVTGTSGNYRRLDAFSINQDPPQLSRVRTQRRTSRSFKLVTGGFVTSSSGRSLYGIDDTRRTITRWTLKNSTNPGETPTAKHTSHVIATASEQQLVRLPFEQGLAQGVSHRLDDLRLAPTPLPLLARCAFTDRALVVGLVNRDLGVASIGSGTLVAQTTLPNKLLPTRSQTITLRAGAQNLDHTSHPIMLADAARDRIVVFADRKAHKVSLPPLNLPVEPILSVLLDMPDTVAVAEDVAIEVRKAAPSIEVKLLSAPDGMRLADDRLVWRPTFTQLGPAKIRLQLRSGEATLMRDYDVTVTSYTAPCPFPNARVALDDSGNNLVAWSSPAPSMIGVIDLATRATSASCIFPTPIIAAEMVGQNIFVLSVDQREAYLTLLDATTLEKKAEQTIAVNSTARYLENAEIVSTDKRVMIQTKGGVNHYFLLPDLQEMSEEDYAEANANAGRLLTHLPAFIRHAPLQVSVNSKIGVRPRSATTTFRARELQSPSDTKQRYAPVESEALSLRLGMQLVPNSKPGYTRLDLVARPLGRLDVIHRWPIDLIDITSQSRDVEVFWSIHGNKVALVFRDRIYVKDLRDVPIRSMPGEFRLQPEFDVFLANSDNATRLGYSLVGGTPPYALAMKLPAAAGTQPNAAWVRRVAGADGNFDVDVSRYVRDQLPKIALAISNWSKETASADSIMTAYAESVKSRFERITGKKPSGIPIAIPVSVIARDAEGQTQKLQHYLLADIARATLDLELNAAVATRWKGTVAATEAAARVARVRGPLASNELVRFSQAMRRGANTAQLSPENLAVAAEQALAKFEERWRQQLAAQQRSVPRHPMRKWTDAGGDSANGRFQQYFAGQVVVTLASGKTMTFAVERLSKVDQAYVRNLTSPSAVEAQSTVNTQFVRQEQLKRLALAAHAFHDTYKLLPPRAFLNDDGRELLSWRVIMLPYLGASELYRLFRLDEPWDSDHNKVLAAYMPSIYKIVDLETQPNHTPLVRLAGPDTVAPPDRHVRFRDIIDGTSNTLFAVIVAGEHAVAWTKPEDVTADPLGQFSKQLWWRDGKTTVVMCDGQLRTVKQTNSEEAWYHAANHHDKQVPALEIE